MYCPICDAELKERLTSYGQTVWDCLTCWKWFNELNILQYSYTHIKPTLPDEIKNKAWSNQLAEYRER